MPPKNPPLNACLFTLLKKMIIHKQTGQHYNNLNKSDKQKVANQINTSVSYFEKVFSNGKAQNFRYNIEYTINNLVLFLKDEFEYIDYNDFCAQNSNFEPEILSIYENKRYGGKKNKFNNYELLQINGWANRRTEELFSKFKKRPRSIPTTDEITAELEKIRNLYKKDKIPSALSVAEGVEEQHGPHLKIVDYIIRCKMRTSNFIGIRIDIQNWSDYEFYDEYKSLFKAKIFECELREAYILDTDSTSFCTKLSKAKEILEQIPKKQKNVDYHYLSGRYFLDIWWKNRNSDKTYLLQSINHFNETESISSVQIMPWWVECYKCIALKLLGRKEEFNKAAYEHKLRVEKLQKKLPDQASLKIHLVTAFILLDNHNNLSDFIKSREIKRPESSSNFNSSLHHHIDLIFCEESEKITLYKQIVESWK